MVCRKYAQMDKVNTELYREFTYGNKETKPHDQISRAATRTIMTILSPDPSGSSVRLFIILHPLVYRTTTLIP